MSKLQVTFGDDKVLFVNPKTEKAEGFPFIERMDGKVAAQALRREVDGRGNVTKAALSLLIEVLSNARLEGYRGATPPNENIAKEFKQAMREVESSHIRPLFMDTLPKTMADADKEKLSGKYMSELWSGGVYALVKAVSSQYFCQVGHLPCVYDEHGTPNHDKMLSLDAMKRLIVNHKEEQKATLTGPEETYKDKYVRHIMKVAQEFNDRSEEANPSLPEVVSAIAALSSMLASFQGIQREYMELATKAASTVTDITAAMDKTVSKAASTPAPAMKQGKAKQASAAH